MGNERALFEVKGVEIKVAVRKAVSERGVQEAAGQELSDTSTLITAFDSQVRRWGREDIRGEDFSKRRELREDAWVCVVCG